MISLVFLLTATATLENVNGTKYVNIPRGIVKLVTKTYQGSPHKRCHIVGDLKYENGELEDFYYYMFYFIGDVSDYIATRNRPPCKTKAEIEVKSKSIKVVFV